jgi:hypothetical protein
VSYFTLLLGDAVVLCLCVGSYAPSLSVAENRIEIAIVHVDVVNATDPELRN